MKYVLPFILLILLSYSCKKPQAFVYRDIRDIKIQKFNLDSSAVSMDLVLFNPNSYSINLKKVDCNVYVDSNYVGKFNLDTMMHINGNAEFHVPLNLRVDLRTILKNSLSMLLAQEVLIGASGTSRVGRGIFYINVPFSYEGRHKLNLF